MINPIYLELIEKMLADLDVIEGLDPEVIKKLKESFISVNGPNKTDLAVILDKPIS